MYRFPHAFGDLRGMKGKSIHFSLFRGLGKWIPTGYPLLRALHLQVPNRRPTLRVPYAGQRLQLGLPDP